MSISISGVSKLYGEQKALDEVSFEISTGEVVGFLGPNGAGKSTMMKIITCYLPPDGGKAEVCGRNVMEDSIEVRKRVGYLPEHNPLYLDMYVKEFLDFVGGIHKIKNRRDRVNEMIDLVGLGREQHKKIGALSKGYRQRVGLAQAMIHDPEVLILDEPTSGLDPNQLVEIRDLITQIGESKTVMLSTHIMQEVEALCSRVIIINQGNIVADAPTQELQKMTGRETKTITVEFARDVTASALAKIENISNVKELPDGSFSLTSNGNVDPRKAISIWAVQNDVLILTLREDEVSLEDVFKQLTTSK